jgi:hypothetical protein
VEQIIVNVGTNNYIARNKKLCIGNKKESLGTTICGTNFLRIRGTKMKITENKTNIQEQKCF